MQLTELEYISFLIQDKKYSTPLVNQAALTCDIGTNSYTAQYKSYIMFYHCQVLACLGSSVVKQKKKNSLKTNPIGIKLSKA